MFESAQLQVRLAAEAIQEAAEAEREQRRRAAAAAEAAGERATAAFVARTMGRPIQPGGAVAGALERMAVQDAEEEVARRRCHSLLDSWLLNMGGDVEQLRALLGTREHQVRAQMGRQQEDLRRRAREAEARRSEVERLNQRLGNEVTYLRSRIETLEALAGGRGYDADPVVG